MRSFRAVVISGLTAIALLTQNISYVEAAAPARPIYVPRAPAEKQLRNEPIKPRAVTSTATPSSAPAADADLPSSSAAQVTLDAGSGMVDAGQLPVELGRPRARDDRSGKATDSKVEVRMLGAGPAAKAGIAGVLFSLRTVEGDGGPTKVRLDYGDFAHAIGGSWASRLRLVQLPACILTTPSDEACRASEPLDTSEDAGQERLTATVDVADAAPGVASARSAASGLTVMAAVAGASGSEGDFSATSLSPSGSWSQTGATGGFTWSYPMVLPPAGTGQSVAPNATLDYDSQAVDGQNTTTNNQASWLGQGWSYDAGYVERTYRPCSDDKALPDEKQTGDLCWAGPIVTLHMPGGSTASLVQDDATKEWHASADNGDEIELRTGADNDAWQGEHWVVTTTDGTKYFFGLNRLPGSTATDATNSAWTVPVYSPRSDDPCYDSSGFGASRCTMAYRWNLDYVKDVHGNATTYSYVVERNNYSSTAGSGADDRLQYVRGGYLDDIRYGLNTAGSGLFGSPAPQRVDFDVAERCFPGGSVSCTDDDFKIENAESWPDVPIDQACKSSGTCDNHSPTFWSRKRLTAVTTKYYDGTAYQKVDAYALRQHFSADTGNELLLDSITRTAWKGGESLEIPAVTFDMSGRANRVENSHGLGPMVRSRLHGIHTETGQVISVAYSGDDGQAGRAKPQCTQATLPTSPSQNTSECYPVRWTPPYEDEILDYFHKYVVTQVTVQDATATAPDRITTYNYIGNPAWHYDDNEVLRPKFRTWAQFRGYAQVETRTGNPNVNINGTPDAWTSTKSFYYRGMDGDRLPDDQHRDITITDSEGTARPDRDAFAGQLLETQQFNGVGGALISKTLSTPVIAATTATRGRGSDLDPVKAQMVRPSASTTYTPKATGGSLVAGTSTKYDAVGRAVEVASTASGALTSCVRTTYADNDTTGVHDKASEVVTYETTCPTTANPAPAIRRAVRTYYDGSSTLGAVTKGDATRTDNAKSQSGSSLSWVTSTAGYDDFGRAITQTVSNPGATPATRTTTTTYTPAGVGALREVKTDLPLAPQSTRRWLDPGRGYATKSTDVAGLVTEGQYDAAGRLTAVWRPGQVKGTDLATETYAYIVRPDRPLSVTTKTLVDAGNGAAQTYQTRVVLYDAFGAIRQAQADAVGGGRVVTDNFNDSHGWSVMANDHWFTTGAPSTTLIGTTQSGVDDWKTTTYDGAGRPTVVTGRKGASTVTSTTRTIYGGDRTTVIPPAGGVTTTSVVDGRGQKTEFYQYSSAPTVSGNVVSGGTSQKQTYGYDSIGQQLQQKTAVGVAGLEATWTNTYDLLGRVTSAVSPDSGNTRTDYYDSGDVKTRTDGANRTLAYTYDALGRPLERRSGSLAGPLLASWVYDTKMTGRLTSSSSVEAGSTYTRTVTGYDADGNTLGTKIGLSLAGFNAEYTSSQTWTKTHLLATSTYASTLSGTSGLNPETLTYSYDSLGNATRMQGTNAYVSDASYTPYGEPSRLVLGTNNQTMTMLWQRDAKTRDVTEVSLSGQLAAPQLEKTNFTYDASGNLTKSVNQQGSASTGPIETQCFAYDNLRQLVDAWSATDACATNPTTLNSNAKIGGPQPYWTTWTYDAAGNRKTQVRHGLGTAASSTTDYTMATAGHAHALTSTKVNNVASTSYTYNDDGAMATRVTSVGSSPSTSTFTYGADGALETAATPGGASRYVEDADGEVLLRQDPTSTTLYLPGQEVTVATSGAVTVNKYYSFNGRNIAVRTNKTAVKYVVTDLNGSNQVAVDPVNWTVTRRYLDPFGNTLSNAAGSPAPGTMPGSRAFMNQPWNTTTSLVDMGARQYDPSIGRFTSVDPLLSPDDPQAANGYTYASNNPVTFTDASGLMLIAEGGGGGSGHSLTSYTPPPPPPPSFADGFVHGAGAGGQELIESLNPANIVDGIHDLISNPPSPWGFVKAVVKGLTHFDDFKAVYDAWQDGDEYDAGYAVGKLVVEIGGDLVMTILGAKAATALSSALKAGTSAVSATTEMTSVSTSIRAVESCLRSFSAETPVVMADGSRKPIAWVKQGERIRTIEPGGGVPVTRPVSRVWVHSDTLIRARFGDRTVTTTADHPYWNATHRQYEELQAFDHGDLVVGEGGRTYRFRGFVSGSESVAPAYNLTVDESHTYLVGAQGILVHNCGGDTYSRPSGYRDGVRSTVWDNSIETSTGRVRDPLTGKFMSANNPWDMGHLPGLEFRKLATRAKEQGMSRSQFLDEHNDPSHYRPELPSSNRSHRGEAPDGY